MTTVENVLLAFQGADQGAGSLISSLGTNMLGLGRNVDDVGNRFKKMGVDVKGAMMMASGAAIGAGYVYFLQQAAQAAAAGEQNWTRFAVSMGATGMQTTAFREQYGALVTEVHNSTGRMKGDIVNTFADLAKAGVRSNEVLKGSVEAMSGVAMLTGKTLDEVEKSWVKILERPTMMTKSLLSAGINVNAFNQVLKTHNLTIEEWGRLTVEQRANLLNEAAALMGASEANAAYKQTAEGMWNLLNQQWKTFMTDIGYAILPLLVELGNTFLPILTGVVQGFTRLDPHLKMFLLLLPLMFAGVMTLGGAFLLMKTTLGGAGGLITLFADVVKYLMAITTESASAAAGIETVNAASAYGGVVNRAGLGQGKQGSAAMGGVSTLQLLGAVALTAAAIYITGQIINAAANEIHSKYEGTPPTTPELSGLRSFVESTSHLGPLSSLGGPFSHDTLMRMGGEASYLGFAEHPGDPWGAFTSGLGYLAGGVGTGISSLFGGGVAHAAKPGQEEQKQDSFWGPKGPFSYKEWLPQGEKAIQDGTKRIVDDFKNLPNKAKSALAGMAKGIGTPINSALDSAKNIVGGGVNWITTSFWGGVNSVIGAFWSLPGQVGGAMQNMYNTIVGWTNSAIGMLRSLYCIIFGCSPGLIPAFRALAREAPVHTATAIGAVKELQGEIRAVPDVSVHGNIQDTNTSTGTVVHHHNETITIDASQLTHEEIKTMLTEIFEAANS